MKPYFCESGATLYHGDCLTVLASLPENSVDTVITDPPYELGFMGKAWDSTGVAFRPETWAAVLRVAKPGAMLLAFGGTRTFHRLTCAIEDAGWEIRDCLSWLYGSGFPKSMDLSKAIDKQGAEAGVLVRDEIARLITASGKTDRELAAVCGVSPSLVRFWRSRERNIQATEAERLRATIGSMVPETARREIIGRAISAGGRSGGNNEYGTALSANPREYDITAPATSSARLWNGWGTALKPAWEPIVLAMKPLDGTFAENAMGWGVAGLNIDGGRIEACERPNIQSKPKDGNYSGVFREGSSVDGTTSKGRWPANVLLDEVAAELLDEQSGVAGAHGGGQMRGAMGYRGNPAQTTPDVGGYGDTGGASRFYYTAKASKSDRGHGNDHPTVKPTELMKYLCTVTATPTGGVVLDPFAGSGTTLVAARECGRPSIGIELEAEHCAIIVKRLAQGCLFMEGGAA